MTADQTRPDGADKPQSNTIPQALLDSIAEFVNAADWQESRKILGRAPLLLSEQAEQAFEGLIQMYLAQGDMRVAYHLAIHRDLIHNCKELGYDRAFALVSTPPAEGLVQAVKLLVDAPDLAVTRAVIDEHPELLTPEGDATFQALIQAAIEASDEQQTEKLASHHHLIRSCVEMGVDAAFVQAAHPTDDETASLLMTLSVLGRNTISVMTDDAGQRDHWREQVEMLHTDAQHHHDALTETLTASVLDLLDGVPLTELEPNLSGPHAAVWKQITDTLGRDDHS